MLWLLRRHPKATTSVSVAAFSPRFFSIEVPALVGFFAAELAITTVGLCLRLAHAVAGPTFSTFRVAFLKVTSAIIHSSRPVIICYLIIGSVICLARPGFPKRFIEKAKA